MSVRVMALVWSLDLPDSQKIVLLALADSANDEGHCWPGVASLSRKCSKSERTVQSVIKELVDAGHLTRREVPGRPCNYTVHPRKDCTPAAVAPHPRKDCGTPPQPLHPNHKEPSKNRHSRASADGGKTIIPVDWKLPAKADLPPKARACAEQWTDASYETHGEAFHGYWRSARRMYAEWDTVWANRVVALHGQVMRDQKFGNAPTGELPRPANDPEAGALWSRYQAGEISFEDFHAARQQRRESTGPPRAIGEIVARLGR